MRKMGKEMKCKRHRQGEQRVGDKEYECETRNERNDDGLFLIVSERSTKARCKICGRHILIHAVGTNFDINESTMYDL